MNVVWNLEGGYSRFLRGSRLEVELLGGPVRRRLAFSPADRARPVDYEFRVRRPLRASGPFGLRWRLTPESILRCRILPEGSSFLGNFRVPAESLAVQWSVEATAEGDVRPDLGRRLLAETAGRSRLLHVWVLPFPRSRELPEALLEAWNGFCDPLDPQEAARLEEGQVVRWRWSGAVRFGLTLPWGIGRLWTLPGRLPGLRHRAGAGADAQARAVFRILQRGEFHLQLRRHRDTLSLRLQRTGERAAEAGLRAQVGVERRLRVVRVDLPVPGPLQGIVDGLSRPALNRIHRELDRALIRRLDLALSLERHARRRSRTLLEAVWPWTAETRAPEGYEALLTGELQVEGPSRIKGSLETLRSRSLTLDLHLLGRRVLGRSRRNEEIRRVSLGPAGELILEAEAVLEKRRHAWDEVQLLKLVSRGRPVEGAEEFFWTWGREGRFSTQRFRSLIHVALHAGLVNRARIPPPDTFPLRLKVILASRFSEEGLKHLAASSREERWTALTRALEWAEPERYGRSTFWRDWIDFEAVRRTFETAPAAAHLETVYPLRGRTEGERRLVLAAYARARRFLDLLERWAGGNSNQKHLTEVYRAGLELPVSLVLHLLCPPDSRRSGLLVQGELQELWGDADLFEEWIGAGL